MRFRALFAAAGLAALLGTAAYPQSWVQIEARPNQPSALARAEAWASELPDVHGFRLASGWYAITLGPYADENEARTRLLELRAIRAVPNDSFISDGTGYRDRFFGDDLAILRPTEPAEPLQPGEETIEQARLGERNLTREDREAVQIALEWEGAYSGRIDASFGPGTRRAMANWQQANGYEPTGVLTTLQRAALLQGYRDVIRSLDMALVRDEDAGIEIEMPRGLVTFGRYDPPFAHYRAATEENVRVVLISQTGDRDSLAALYDILQTLRIVPQKGPRELKATSFEITGENRRIVSYTYAQQVGDAIKGFTLVWPAGDEKRRRLALEAMKASFNPIDGVLPETIDQGAQDIDLISGLEIRRPERSRSGFFIDGSGAVLTTAEAVRQCERVTINGETEADVAAEDAGLGLALLRPKETLAPISVARLASIEPRLQSDVAVAGYSFGGLLPAPSITYGLLADVKGLDGNPGVQRLSLSSRPEDAGGPVFDGSGAVMGMLNAMEDTDRQLPEDVAFATDAPVLAEFLSLNGVNPAAADGGADLAPEDLTLLAADLTVAVSCWN